MLVSFGIDLYSFQFVSVSSFPLVTAIYRNKNSIDKSVNKSVFIVGERTFSPTFVEL
jgi:hypothetical protein